MVTGHSLRGLGHQRHSGRLCRGCRNWLRTGHGSGGTGMRAYLGPESHTGERARHTCGRGRWRTAGWAATLAATGAANGALGFTCALASARARCLAVGHMPLDTLHHLRNGDDIHGCTHGRSAVRERAPNTRRRPSRMTYMGSLPEHAAVPLGEPHLHTAPPSTRNASTGNHVPAHMNALQVTAAHTHACTERPYLFRWVC